MFDYTAGKAFRRKDRKERKADGKQLKA